MTYTKTWDEFEKAADVLYKSEPHRVSCRSISYENQLLSQGDRTYVIAAKLSFSAGLS